jgi:hypothetical protein
LDLERIGVPKGIVYEKNLGPKTEEIAKAITKYDP